MEEKKINLGSVRGPEGKAASVSVGSVTTGEPGTQASVTNSGTSSDAVLNFTIPRGSNGADGAAGAKGEKGDPGKNGTDGKSPYQVAVENGFTGTEDDFNTALLALKDSPFLPMNISSDGATVTSQEGDIKFYSLNGKVASISASESSLSQFAILPEVAQIISQNLSNGNMSIFQSEKGSTAIQSFSQQKTFTFLVSQEGFTFSGSPVSVPSPTSESHAATKQYVDENTGGKRSCKFSVGSSSYGWTSKDCDYLCDGTNDQEEINAAIQALPASGGEIILLSGDYYISAPITANKPSVKISGNGNSTRILRYWNSTQQEGAISLSGDFCSVRDLMITGQSTSNENNFGINVSSDGCIVENVFLVSLREGVHISGNSCRIKGCVFASCFNGVGMYSDSGCIISDNVMSESSWSGVYGSNSNLNTITGNFMNECPKGISLVNCQKNVVNSNAVTDFKESAIDISGTSQKNTVMGNAAIYDGSGYGYTIYAGNQTSYNLFCGNNIMGKNYENLGSNNTFADNKYN